MLDEMTNPAVIDFVLGNEDATEVEIELAQRLDMALAEISLLVAERAKLLCELHQKIEETYGDT